MPAVQEKNIAVVCNKMAGAGRAEQLAVGITHTLSGLHIPFTVFTDNWPAAFRGYTAIWIIGGDGTLNYFINHYPGIEIPLALFRGGTGNDFHWLLYGAISFEHQLQLVLAADPKPIDLGRCNDRFFLNGAGIGFEGEVSRGLAGKKKRAGKSSFLRMVLKKIFLYRSKVYNLAADETRLDNKKLLMIDVVNGKRAGGGFHIAPLSEPDDGLLDVIIINALHPLLRLRWLPVIEKGQHLGLSFIHHSRTRKIYIESKSLIQAHLDGEYYTAASLDIEILPGKLLFYY